MMSRTWYFHCPAIELKFFKLEMLVKTAKRNDSMNMWIPFEVPAKSMDNGKKPVMDDIGISKIFIRRRRDVINSLLFLVNIVELVLKDFINSVRKLDKQCSVIEEEHSALLRDSKKHMSMINIENLCSNFLSPDLRIFETTSRAEPRFTSKGNGM